MRKIFFCVKGLAWFVIYETVVKTAGRQNVLALWIVLWKSQAEFLTRS
jgi:hypothetical protein